jgi:hypothetical protein
VTTAVFDPAAVARLSPRAFADDALFAYWDGAGEETAARATAVGPHAIGAAIAAVWGEQVRHPLVWVQDGADCFVEGRLLGDGREAFATFVAALQIDDSGAVARCLAFHCPPVEPSPTWGPREPARGDGARSLLERYFECLTAGDFEGACECFSEDCLYSHPPYSAGAERAEFRGRAALLAGFANVRGARPTRLPRIVCCVQDGSDCFIEGVVDGDPPRGSFLSSVSLDGDGLIRRYVAFYSDSRVPRL